MSRCLIFLFLLFALCAWADGVQDRALDAVLDSGRPYHARATQIAKVRSNLCQSDVDAVHTFLERKDGGDLAPLEFNSLKNDLVLCLTNGDWSYTWNGENRLVRAENAVTGAALEFDYDYMGRRIFKNVYHGTVLEKHLLFVYDGYKLIEERDALDGGALVRQYAWQPEVLGRDVPLTVHDAASNGTYYYHTDANKNVTELTDESSTVVALYEYSPFGTVTRATGPLAADNPFRFSSEYSDAETDLVYYNYRYYSPELGRWISRDPIEELGGYNLYGMLGNNPLLGWDVLGLEVEAVYDKTKGTLTVRDIDTGETVCVEVESGGKPMGEPIPNGNYDILDPVRIDKKNKGEDFYRLEPKDKNYGDDKDEKSGRNKFRLHRPGRTIGCIVCRNREGWEAVRNILTETSKTPVQVKSKSRNPFNWGKMEKNNRRGTLKVIQGGQPND